MAPLLFLFLCCLILLSVDSGVTDKEAPWYTIDITKSAEDNLEPICNDLKDKIQPTFNEMESKIPRLFKRKVHEMSMDYWPKVTKWYKDSIIYWSKCLDKTIAEMLTVSLVYEFIAMCTSIVLIDNDNKIWHGRNQDFPELLRDITINVKYVKTVDGSEEVIFYGTTFAGFVGM